MTTLTVALAQITPHSGEPERAREQHLELIERARGQGADVLVFPELSLTGYVLGHSHVATPQKDPVDGGKVT